MSATRPARPSSSPLPQMECDVRGREVDGDDVATGPDRSVAHPMDGRWQPMARPLCARRRMIGGVRRPPHGGAGGEVQRFAPRGPRRAHRTARGRWPRPVGRRRAHFRRAARSARAGRRPPVSGTGASPLPVETRHPPRPGAPVGRPPPLPPRRRPRDRAARASAAAGGPCSTGERTATRPPRGTGPPRVARRSDVAPSAPAPAVARCIVVATGLASGFSEERGQLGRDPPPP